MYLKSSASDFDGEDGINKTLVTKNYKNWITLF